MVTVPKLLLLLLDSSTAYEELKEEAASNFSFAGSYGCVGGFPSGILERIITELICRDTCNTWHLPDNVKILGQAFRSLFEIKFFAAMMM